MFVMYMAWLYSIGLVVGLSILECQLLLRFVSGVSSCSYVVWTLYSLGGWGLVCHVKSLAGWALYPLVWAWQGSDWGGLGTGLGIAVEGPSYFLCFLFASFDIAGRSVVALFFSYLMWGVVPVPAFSAGRACHLVVQCVVCSSFGYVAYVLGFLLGASALRVFCSFRSAVSGYISGQLLRVRRLGLLLYYVSCPLVSGFGGVCWFGICHFFCLHQALFVFSSCLCLLFHAWSALCVLCFCFRVWYLLSDSLSLVYLGHSSYTVYLI